MSVKSVLIIANFQKKEAQQLAAAIEGYLNGRNITVRVFGFSGQAEISIQDPYDLVITLGGDGTVLFAARTVASFGIPILPVNLGNFGFITEVSKDEWRVDLDRAIAGDIKTGRRMMLEYSLSRGNEDTQYELSRGNALNDVVLSGSGISKLINLMVHIDHREHIEYRADGIILSTATGSTAYSAAAGGPILHPEMEAIILNPICPFTLSHRPLVLPSGVEMQVEVLEQQRTEVTLTVDGQLSYQLKPADMLHVRAAAEPAKILYSGSRSFYEVLRAKLSWTGGPE
jgi:NAD+ kinase